tara:strand:- start:1986 stop:2564 length:579 start_codon:yes stop_codon:yes gene_type:complete
MQTRSGKKLNNSNLTLAVRGLANNKSVNTERVITTAMNASPEYFQKLGQAYISRLDELSMNQKARYEQSLIIQDMGKTIMNTMLLIGIPVLLRKGVAWKFNGPIANLQADYEWKLRLLNESNSFMEKVSEGAQAALVKTAVEALRVQKFAWMETLDILLIVWFIGMSLLFMIHILSSRRDISFTLFRIRNTR